MYKWRIEEKMKEGQSEEETFRHSLKLALASLFTACTNLAGEKTLCLVILTQVE